MGRLFFIVTAFALTSNLLLCGLELSWLRRRRPYSRGLAAGICLWTGLMVALFALQIFSPFSWRPFVRHWLYFPISAEIVWNLILLQPMVVIALLVTLGLRLFRPVKKTEEAVDLSPEALSRRKFVYLLACGAAPATAIGMGVHGTLTRFDLRVRDYTLALPNLPAELEGFTLAHVSDLHSGIFCGPTRLKLISDATNDLKADLIVITGDVINTSMSEFPEALAAMKRMEAPRGILLCEGNHDVIPGPGLVARACAENGLPMLMDRSVVLPVNGKRLVVGGLSWTIQAPSSFIEGLYPARQEGDVRLLLAHHPDLFDSAGGTDLVLAGHTHGGQLMVGPLGFGPLFFKYWSGLYRKPTTSLIVSNGSGDWFPCRIGAPAEIARVRLTRAMS